MAIGFNTSSVGIGLQPTSTNIDTGLNAPVVTTEQSQSVLDQSVTGAVAYTPVFTQDQVNQNLAATGYSGVGLNPNAGGTGINFSATTGLTVSPSGTFAAPTAASLPGAGSATDDLGTTTGATAAQQQVLTAASATNSIITPKGNVLDQYASYTYSLSLYLITPDQFNALSNGPPNFASWILLMQSGGAQNNPASSTNPTSGRSPYFSLDYYMDNLVLESRITGSGSGFAHNVNHLTFTVLEPSGLTLPSALAGAVQNLYKQNNVVDKQGNPVSYAFADYVMVIKFYGYNDQGQLVQAGTVDATSSSNGSQAGATSATQGAVVTKYYPFRLNKLEFRLTTKGVEYTLKGVPHAYQIAASAQRGTIPENFNLVGKTVADILNGNQSKGTKVSPSDGRQSTNSIKTAAPAPASNWTTATQVNANGVGYTTDWTALGN